MSLEKNRKLLSQRPNSDKIMAAPAPTGGLKGIIAGLFLSDIINDILCNY